MFLVSSVSCIERERERSRRLTPGKNLSRHSLSILCDRSLHLERDLETEAKTETSKTCGNRHPWKQYTLTSLAAIPKSERGER